jgi:hypothetical protein
MTFEGKFTCQTQWGSADLHAQTLPPAALPSLEQALIQQHASMRPQRQPLPLQSPPPAQHSDSYWWREETEWDGSDWDGWVWNERDRWHLPPPTPAPVAPEQPPVAPEQPPPTTPVADAPPPLEPDPLWSSLEAEIAAQHDDPDYWMSNLPGAFGEEAFSDFSIYHDGNLIEVWRRLPDGSYVFVERYDLKVVAYLRNFSARVRQGDPRTLPEVLDQDCVHQVDVPSSEYYGYTFEEIAQRWPAEMDDLIDTMNNSGMHRTQIALRLYVTLRRQLMTLLRHILERKN